MAVGGRAIVGAVRRYLAILRRPGALAFSATGLVARLPISMVGLGIVLLVQAATGSYGVAGAVAATHLLANACVAVVQGRLIDRLGQRRVVGVAVTVWASSLAALLVAVEAGWPRWTAYAFAAVAGACLPPVGSCVRARWSHLLEDPADRQTAFALEAVGDETVFVVGPILATVLATAVHPAAGLLTALVTGLTGGYAFIAQRRTEPPPHPRAAAVADRPRMPWPTVALLTVVSCALGTLFGAAEVTTVAFADERGAKGYAGVLLALWATGSLLAGLLTGAVTWRVGPQVRLRHGATGMALVMVPLTFVGSMAAMAVALFLAGFAIAPTLIASMSLLEQAVPASRLTEGMGFLHTGLIAGVAPGAAIAGAVVDAHGASPAYLVAVAGGAVAFAAAQLTRLTPTARTEAAPVTVPG